MLPNDVGGQPRVVFRVGITGHRALTADQSAHVREVCLTVLKGAHATASSVVAEAHAGYRAGPPLIRAVSCLAAGSDQIHAEATLKLGREPAWSGQFELCAVLPFAVDLYREDFVYRDGSAGTTDTFDSLLAAADRRIALSGDRSTLPARLLAYENAGRLMVAGCDLLISVRAPTATLTQGSTTQMTVEALAAGLPVVAVNLSEPVAVFIESIDSQGQFHRDGFDAGTLDHVTRRVLLPPKLAGAGRKQKAWETLRHELLDLPQPHRPEKALAVGYRLPWAALQWIAKPATKPSWHAPCPATHVSVPPTPFQPLYKQAEALSKHYAILWRGSFMLNYLLGASAVTFALLQYAIGSPSNAWTIAEAVTLVLLLGNFFASRYRAWHERFGDFRFFTEQLRQARVMSLLGVSLPDIRNDGDALEGRRDGWINWYCRAMLRSSVPVDAPLADKCGWVIHGWLAKQIAYHKNYARNREGLERALTWCALAFFVLACLSCVVHLLHIVPEEFDPWLIFIAAAAPAWTGVCHSIGIQGEFQTVAERSEAVGEKLELVCEELEQAVAAGRLTNATLLSKAVEASRVSLYEVAGWRRVSQMHPVLPP